MYCYLAIIWRLLQLFHRPFLDVILSEIIWKLLQLSGEKKSGYFDNRLKIFDVILFENCLIVISDVWKSIIWL